MCVCVCTVAYVCVLGRKGSVCMIFWTVDHTRDRVGCLSLVEVSPACSIMKATYSVCGFYSTHWHAAPDTYILMPNLLHAGMDHKLHRAQHATLPLPSHTAPTTHTHTHTHTHTYIPAQCPHIQHPPYTPSTPIQHTYSTHHTFLVQPHICAMLCVTLRVMFLATAGLEH